MLTKYNKIVIKIGSALIINRDSYNLRTSWLDSLISDIKEIFKDKEVILVTSGSIAYGCRELKINRKDLSIEQTQAVAAFGQALLINYLKNHFKNFDLKIAQILITHDDLQNRKRYLNIKSTISKLSEMNIIPVINENDTTATDEIKFGDNDNLSAQISGVTGADLLILLSDVSGLYDSDPHLNKNAKLIRQINDINSDIMKLAGESSSSVGTGGMNSKVIAAKNANFSGADVIITSGLKQYPLTNLIKEKEYSLFKSSSNPLSNRKKWLSHLKNNGCLTIDKGAYEALLSGKSLLPIGVIKSKDNFSRGDIISILFDGKKIAQGIINFNSVETQKIIGKSSKEIKNILSLVNSTSLIHRDNMVILNEIKNEK